MASSTGEKPPPSSSIVANAPPPPVSMEAKMTVATSHGHCQQLNDMLLSKEDASTLPKPPSPAIDYQLLAAACSGSFQNLESLLNGEGRRRSRTIESSAMPRASDDEEAFLRESLLDGVTSNGDNLLHVVATNGDNEDFLNKAGLIHRKAVNLLLLQNNQGDTPLHCAARAGKSRMVALLIDLSKGQDNNASTSVKALLETENKIKETALHDAVRIGNNDMVKLLMEEHPQLASFPEIGTSPLYVAILLGHQIIANTLYQMSDKILSYSGPNGQNALHAAVFRGKAPTKMLLDWKKEDLTMQSDEKGNTPLHFAASVLRQRGRRAVRLLLLEANPDALFQPDNNGSYPIHIAASVGADMATTDFLKKSPTCAGLRDARGRTFLHVAADKSKIWVVCYACWNAPSLSSWVLNMQDKDGNTALHVAVQARSLPLFCALLGNKQVLLDLTNKKGETPLDIACRNVPTGIYYTQISEAKIRYALKLFGAKRGICRLDYFEENNTAQTRMDKTHKLKNVKEATQSLCIGAVLVATVTFGATFAMPGGYRADDHTNGGTPTLAGRYAFDAFTVANTLAFTFSAMATLSLMSSGSPLVNPESRTMHLGAAYYLMSISVTSLVVAFALGTYMILAPVAHNTVIAVCVLSSLVLLYQNLEFAAKHFVLIPPCCMRKGIRFTFRWSVQSILMTILFKHWPIIVIFCSTAKNYHVPIVEPPVQPPTPLA